MTRQPNIVHRVATVGGLLLSPHGVVLGAQSALWENIERIGPKRIFGKWGWHHDFWTNYRS